MTKRIIPCLDVKDGRVVKGAKFQNLVDVSDPIRLAQTYSEHGADELVMYDITASSEGRRIAVELVEKIARQVTIPFIVGGGIRSLEDIRQVFQAGAIKSPLPAPPSRILNSFRKLQRSSAAASSPPLTPKRWPAAGMCCTGRVDTGRDAVEWAQELGFETGRNCAQFDRH